MAISRRLARRLLIVAFMCVSMLVLVATTSVAQQQPTGPTTRPERTNYEETSLYEDVLQFFRDLEKTTPLMRLEFFGKTHEGRDMPLVTISNPPVSMPSEAVGTGKPVVFIMANIH